MKITNEFTVHTPIEAAWKLLTDLEAIAPCMPGAVLTGVEDDTYKGKVKIKVGPVISEFAGTARFLERSDADHRASIDAKGRDARSAGNASAVVTAVLRPSGDSTTVSVDTDLKISGKLAQFGSGMIKEVSSKLLAQFVTNLEAKLAADTVTPDGPASDAAPAAPAASDAAPAASSAAAPAVSGAAAPAVSGAAAPAVSGAAAPAVSDAGPVVSEAAVPAESEPVVAPSAAAVETVPDTAVSSPPLNGATSASSRAASRFPAVPAPSGSAGSSATAPLPASQAGSSDPDELAVSPAPRAAPASGSTAATRSRALTADEPEPIDLLSVAGSSVYKRLIPVAVVVAVIGAVIAWLVGRR
jgi:carbon monoxide dehydrogenase subunit G